ncbi:hypothetical protein KRR39_09860 [Nocardioides panacis]|uniref:Uncharacterized protein n=1 Tax=Nocardioides panacis TaxID=2849501 RepID=A0A975T1U9_9ACTN|nr:hypothetical protein [Nocardioides panacis]QWZ10001.1 hypothetical protein KRR39_09860 [Nocardioides panacis]
MDESRLRSMRGDVEAHVELPDFAVVAERGRQVRRRRAVVAGAAVAAAVLVATVGVAQTFDRERTQGPVQQPAPTIDRTGAARVLSDPDAQVDADASKVDGAGDLLAVVTVPGGSDDCGAPGGTALRWSAVDGGSRSWLERRRPVVPLVDGFVLGSVPASCRSGAPAETRAYLVDGAGKARALAWGPGAEGVCAAQPADPRCRFDVQRASGSLDPDISLPRGTEPVATGPAEVRWARSSDGRRLSWSDDGRSWRSRTTSLPGGSIVSATAAGAWGVLAGNTSVEYTSDAGATWHSRDLSAALRGVRIADVDWTVTRSGVLLGVTRLVGRGDVLFRSTDPSWTRFVETDVHTSFGLVSPMVQGEAVYVVDDERWLVSTDDGATWRRTPALPRAR